MTLDSLARWSVGSPRIFATRAVADDFGEPAARDVGDRDVLEHVSQACAQRHPHLRQFPGRATVLQLVGAHPLYGGEWSFDRAQHVGNADFGGRPGELIAPV